MKKSYPPTYQQPPQGWICFHCGEHFTEFNAARDHFGPTPESVTACILVARSLLKQQEVIRSLRGIRVDEINEALSKKKPVSKLHHI